MNKYELDKHLKKYDKVELFYKDYFLARQNPDKYKEFLDNLDIDFIKNNSVLFPEIRIDIGLIKEDSVPNFKDEFNVLVNKHVRYTPVFKHKHEYFEMVYVYSGHCEQTIMDNQINIYEGDIFILSPNVEHSIAVFDDSVVIKLLIRKSIFDNAFLEVLSDEKIIIENISSLIKHPVL